MILQEIKIADGDQKYIEGKDGVYDPFANRQIKNANSNLRSTANLIKSSLGSGLLAMPLAFSNSGYATGLFGTIVIGIICTHCVEILVNTSHEACRRLKRPMLTYAETCEAAFQIGPKQTRWLSGTALMFAELALCFAYLAVCCVYVIIVAESIQQLVDKYWEQPVEVWCAILLVPLVIITQIRTLKWLAPFSMIANILLVGTFAICLYYIFKGGIDAGRIKEREAFGNPGRLPAYFSTVIFAMEGVGVVMPTENTMKNPKAFLGCPGVLYISMIIITFLYTSLGFLGYLQYGDDLKGSLTLNLPIDEIPAIGAKVFIIIAIFATYPLQFYIAFDILWKYSKNKLPEKRRNLWNVLMRIGFVLLTVAVAVALPLLEEIINLVGAFFYSILGLIIPTIIDTVIRFDGRFGRGHWILWKNIVLLICGFGALISGCTLAIMDIIAKSQGLNTQ